MDISTPNLQLATATVSYSDLDQLETGPIMNVVGILPHPFRVNCGWFIGFYHVFSMS